MSLIHWTDELLAIQACKSAVEWSKRYSTESSAWNDCERGDWLLWRVGKRSGPPMSNTRRKLVGAVAECAAMAALIYELKHPGDDRPRNAINLCRRFASGEEIGISVMQAVANDVYQIEYDTHVAVATAYVEDAAYAAEVTTAIVNLYATELVRPEHVVFSIILRECADIVRRHYPAGVISTRLESL